jgi:hypothetical protein
LYSTNKQIEIMKVQITYTEVQTFKNTIEVEMTEKQYKEYLKKSLFEQEQEFDFTANTDETQHYSTEVQSIDLEIIK